MHVALHTDHCPEDKLDAYMRPLVKLSQERVARGEDPLFGSHMWDGSAVPLAENLAIASELLDECTKAHVIMEMEIGVVGGEEDGVVGEINEKLYSTPADALATAEAVGLGERGRYILAATFGNVHGVYKPGHVSLRPAVLKEIQDAVGAKYGKDKPFDLVFHGGSGSALEEIREAIGYGVVKMNVDTDTQYAFTRPVAAHMFTNYDGVLKVDGEVGRQEGLRPAGLGQGRRGGHGRPGAARLRGPHVGGQAADLTAPRRRLRAGRGDRAGWVPWNIRICSPGRRPPTCPRIRPPPNWSTGADPTAVAAAHPACLAAWAALADAAMDRGEPVASYAYRPDRLPPRPGPVAPGRLEGPRAGPVGARAEPGLPAVPARAGPGRGRDRRAGRGRALPCLPRRLQPAGRRGTERRLITQAPGVPSHLAAGSREPRPQHREGAGHMPAIVLVGAQWGDEGKGKATDLLGDRVDFVVRYQGGNNAGHTVVIGEESYALHLLPSGVLSPSVTPVIGNGVVIDPEVLFGEIDGLAARGVSCDRLLISASAHLIMPHHRALDRVTERYLGNARIGTTGRGIGPAYARQGGAGPASACRTCSTPASCGRNWTWRCMEKNQVLTKVYNRRGIDAGAVAAEYVAYGEKLRRYVADTVLVLNRALDEGKSVLLEGAQATLLDVDHGTYPFVTSSSPAAGGACAGSGIGPTRITTVIGIVKAYTTRVGAGPFPTELDGDQGEWLRKAGGEYGVTTGRARALRLVRRRDRPVRRAGQRCHRLLHHQAGCPVRAGQGAGLRRLRRGRHQAHRDADDADRVPPRGAGVSSTSTAGGRTCRRPGSSPTCPATRSSTCGRWRR